MYSICTYMAENNDALNLVEGEKVYVIGMCSVNFTFNYCPSYYSDRDR